MPWVRKGRKEYWHEPTVELAEDGFARQVDRLRALISVDAGRRKPGRWGAIRGAIDCPLCTSEVEYTLWPCGSLRARCMTRRCCGIA